MYLMIYQDVEVEKGYILRVCEGPEAGLAWIVAPLLDHTKMRKFSGTERAGSSKDLSGKTCDALAHFSLCDSRNALVFVDVQGECSPKCIQSITNHYTRNYNRIWTVTEGRFV